MVRKVPLAGPTGAPRTHVNIEQVGGTAQTGRDWSDDLDELQRLDAVEKANEHNLAVTAATDILAAVINATTAPCLFRIMVAMNTAGVFSARITKAAVTVGVNFNAGGNLVANALYAFDLLVHSGDTVNFRHSVNATMLLLRVQEIDVGAQ